jgi:hypothetical protein
MSLSLFNYAYFRCWIWLWSLVAWGPHCAGDNFHRFASQDYWNSVGNGGKLLSMIRFFFFFRRIQTVVAAFP